MESGTEKLLSQARHAEATNSTAQAEGAVAIAAMRQTLKDLRGLHLVAGQLKGRYTAHMRSLEADSKRQHSLRAAADTRIEALGREETALKAMAKEEAKRIRVCGEALTKAQKSSSPMSLAKRQSDIQTIKNLRNDKALLQQMLNRTKASCEVDLDGLKSENAKLEVARKQLLMERSELRHRIEVLTHERSSLVNASQSIQAKANMVEESYKVQLADLNEKVENTEEQLGDKLELAQEAEAENRNLQKDKEACQQTLASLQRDLASASDEKAQLLESVRVLMRQGAAVAQVPPSPKDMQHNAKTRPVEDQNHSRLDEVAWMGKTRKIDEYIVQLSAAEQAEAARHAAASVAQPQPRRLSQLGHYFGVKLSTARAEGADRHQVASAMREGADASGPSAPVAHADVGRIGIAAAPPSLRARARKKDHQEEAPTAGRRSDASSSREPVARADVGRMGIAAAPLPRRPSPNRHDARDHVNVTHAVAPPADVPAGNAGATQSFSPIASAMQDLSEADRIAELAATPQDFPSDQDPAARDLAAAEASIASASLG